MRARPPRDASAGPAGRGWSRRACRLRRREPASAAFRDCFVRRAGSPDPSEVPPGCEPQPGPAAPVFGPAAQAATAATWLHAVERTLGLEVVVFLAALGLVRLLPRRAPAPEQSGAAAAA